MTANQRSDCVQNANWCPIHLTGSHDYDKCAQKNDPRYLCGVNGCVKHHHSSLHGSTTPFLATVNTMQTGQVLRNDPVLLSMQTVPTPSGDINCFFDDGSDCSLILNSAAGRLGRRSINGSYNCQWSCQNQQPCIFSDSFRSPRLSI